MGAEREKDLSWGGAVARESWGGEEEGGGGGEGGGEGEGGRGREGRKGEREEGRQWVSKTCSSAVVTRLSQNSTGIINTCLTN